MPTYTYHCGKCDNSFDLFHSISDNSEKKCPDCNKPVTRLMGGGILLRSSSSGPTAAATPSFHSNPFT